MNNAYEKTMDILSIIPWMWVIACYLAYNLIKDAPTAWHAIFIYFVICLFMANDSDNQKHAKEIMDSLKDRK